MEEVTQQPAPLQGKRLLWLIPLPAKKPKVAKPVKALAATDDANTFYGKAMEWTHRADKVINLILGYLLAIASVLGFMDVLSNGQVLSHVPQAFYIWLAIMGLGVDFQLLLVIGRFPDLVQTVESKTLKVVFILFNLGFLAFLAYMSAIIGAVFTQHVDAGTGTVTDAMTALHIDAHTFVFQRATLATLLLVLMAVDRTLERWRMRRAIQNSPENATQATPAPLQGNTAADGGKSDIEKLIEAMQAMNAQTLASMQAMQQQQLQVTIEQATRVTVEAVKQSLEALPFNQVPQLPPPQIQNTVDNAFKASPDNFQQGYRQKFEELLRDKPDVTVEEAMRIVQCSKPTAEKWLAKLSENAYKA